MQNLLFILLTGVGTPFMDEGFIKPQPRPALQVVKPQPRPEEPILQIGLEDLEKIERVVWAEANTEGIAGRDAVRGVIFNRLASDRFGNDIDSVLVAGEFEPIDTYKTIDAIPVPEDQLQEGIQELVDYIQLGKDGSQGSTFFQNRERTEARGTSFGGSNPLVIGKHTFYDGYEGQEPVTDIRGSHNIKVNIEMAKSDLNLADSKKGLSEEDKKMAENKEQADVSEGDTNEDGFLSNAEREVQLALQNNELVDDEDIPVKMYHGGMACGCEGDCTGDCGFMGYDDVSGNPIPLGSSAENVRDDIEANLSTGEYVLPAHVVKYHGLKHIMEMQAEAEMGLMSMKMDGLIQSVDVEGVVECPMCQGRGCEHCENTGYHSDKSGSESTEETEVQASDDTEQEEADEEGETPEEIPSEEMDVEVATVQVDDQLDDEEDKELSPTSKPLPAIMKKQKFVFAI